MTKGVAHHSSSTSAISRSPGGDILFSESTFGKEIEKAS